MSKDRLKANHLENNKKEVYFTLTQKGKGAYEIHEKFHDSENSKVANILKKDTEEEQRTIDRFLDDIITGLSKDI